jgi:hypothetical protein
LLLLCIYLGTYASEKLKKKKKKKNSYHLVVGSNERVLIQMILAIARCSLILSAKHSFTTDLDSAAISHLGTSKDPG